MVLKLVAWKQLKCGFCGQEGTWWAESALKIAEVWQWWELLKHWWREQLKIAKVWWEFPKRWWRELLKGRDWKDPKVLVETAKALSAVTETPEAVDTGLPEGPTSLSGRCGGGQLRADAGAVRTWGN